MFATTSGLNLADLLDRFPERQQEADGGFVVSCPAHDDSHVSLRIAVSDRGNLLVHCRAGCPKDEVLTGLGLTMSDLFNVSTAGVQTIAAQEATTVPLGTADQAALAIYLDRTSTALKEDTATAREALEYAGRRFGLTAEQAHSLGLGVDDTRINAGSLGLSAQAYRDTTRLVVPFADFDGVPRGLQARALSPAARVRWSGPVNPKDGGTWAKFGVFRADSGRPDAQVLITEGPGDALTAVAAGYDAVLVRGAALAQSANLADELATGLKGRRVVVAGDSDGAGKKFTQQVAEALSARGVETRSLVLPTGVNDLSEWFEKDRTRFTGELDKAIINAPRYGEEDVIADRLVASLSTLLTDVANARALLAYIQSRGCDVRYTNEAGFIVYSGHDRGTWALDTTEWVRTQAHAAVPYIQRTVLDQVHQVEAQALTMSSDAAKERIQGAAKALRSKLGSGALVGWAMSSRGVDAMLKELRALDGVPAKLTDFDRHPSLLAVSNGVVNLESRTLDPYDDRTKELLLMRRVDLPYCRTASNPRWNRFITEIADNHDGLATYLRRLTGYGITGHNSEQMIAVFLGGGANGKSVLMETLTAIFEAHTVITPFSTFERRDSNGGASPDIAQMAGARMVVASEGEAGRPMAEALLKRLSGGESVTARFLYKDSFTFVPQALITLVSNHPPVFRSQDHGIWRRIRLIPFTRRFEAHEQDRHLTAKFTGAYVPQAAWREDDDMGDGPAGILAWAIEGAYEWFTHGLEEPSVVRSGTSELKTTNDQLGDFTRAYLVKDPEGRITAKDAYLAYQTWADEEGLSGRDVWTRKTFLSAMEERGAVTYILNGAKALRGFRKRTARDDLNTADDAAVFATITPEQEEDQA